MTLTLCLTFDMDAEFSWLVRGDGTEQGPVWESQGRYGPEEGLSRVLSLLSRHGLQATFFVPGQTIERYPSRLHEIVDAGHEIACHGYSHRRRDWLSPEEEREELATATKLIEEISGVRPVGFRSPAAEFSGKTLSLLVEYGYLYSSDYFDRDSAYLMQIADPPGELVQLPFAWIFDDAPFFRYNNRIHSHLAAPSHVLETWILEYEGLRLEDNRIMVLAMHPQYIGRPSRIWLLDQFLQRVLADGDSRIVTARALAQETKLRYLA